VRSNGAVSRLQTEFPFVLPKGYVDRDGNLHREGTMRLATANDEIAPLRDPRVRQNEAYMTIIVLSRVITRLGSLVDGDVNPGIIENIFSADLDYLQSLYRQINEAGATTVPAVCPDCGRGFDVQGVAPAGES
jgi:hypothetical protein